MLEDNDIKKIKVRHYIHFELRKPRERNACPKCNSVTVRKRRGTRDYVCRECKWKGESIKKIIW